MFVLTICIVWLQLAFIVENNAKTRSPITWKNWIILVLIIPYLLVKAIEAISLKCSFNKLKEWLAK